MSSTSKDSPVLRWLLDAVRHYPLQAGAVVLLSMMTSLTEGLGIGLLMPLVTTLLHGEPSRSPQLGEWDRILPGLTGHAGQQDLLLPGAFLIVALVALRAGLNAFHAYLSHWISGRVSCDIRSRIHENLLGVAYEYVSASRSSHLLNTLDNEAWRATEAITTCFGLVSSACMSCVMSVILLAISWQLTLLVAGAVALASAVMLLFNRPLRELGESALIAAEELYERAVELFEAMRTIRVFGREQKSQWAYDRSSHRLFELSMRRVRLDGLSALAQESLYACTFALTIFAALQLQVAGPLLVVYLAMLHRLHPHVRAIESARMELAGLQPSVNAVAALSDLPRWAESNAGSAKVTALADAVRFESVSFRYGASTGEPRTALEDVSVELPARKVTAIAGCSGAGKTTLINLLLRLYDPSSGRITVDGKPLPELDLAGWRSQLALAGQDAELVSGSVRANIAHGKDDATTAEIMEAARRARVHDFIMTLPNGYDTRVGSRGALLSGGQRQRIGLARALIRKSAILVLDEATNSLDSMTEREVLDALDALRGQVTMIVIAHRISTIQSADHVIMLEGGRVREQGPPAALLANGGLFQRMARLQQADPSATAPRPAR